MQIGFFGGYFGILLLMVLSPVPPEVFLPMAGFLVAQGKLNFFYIVLTAFVGFLISVLPWYIAGRYLGRQGLKKLSNRRYKWLKISQEKLQKANRWFYRYGGRAILLSLLIPGFRNIMSVPAGLSGMSFGTYLFYTATGATVWLTLLTYAGYVLGDRYSLIDEYFSAASPAIGLILVAIGAFWGIRRYLRGKTSYSD